ncbi:unnamed protein product [Sphagnum balticum]
MLVPNPNLFLETRSGSKVYLQKCVSSVPELIRDFQAGIAQTVLIRDLQAGIAQTVAPTLDDSGIGSDLAETRETIEEDATGQVRTLRDI